MYTIKWNEGGQHTRGRIKITDAKKSAKDISKRITGIVTVTDRDGDEVACYKQGKTHVHLFGTLPEADQPQAHLSPLSGQDNGLAQTD